MEIFNPLRWSTVEHSGNVANNTASDKTLTLTKPCILRFMFVYTAANSTWLLLYRQAATSYANVLADVASNSTARYGMSETCLFLTPGTYIMRMYNASGGAVDMKAVMCFENLF